jgi:hypothetical protein
MANMDYGFRLLNKQCVESRDGFVVQFTGRFTLEYRCKNFVMECSVEPGVPTCVSVPPLPFGNLTPKHRSEIVERISAALDFLGLEHDIA